MKICHISSWETTFFCKQLEKHQSEIQVTPPAGKFYMYGQLNEKFRMFDPIKLFCTVSAQILKENLSW